MSQQRVSAEDMAIKPTAVALDIQFPDLLLYLEKINYTSEHQ